MKVLLMIQQAKDWQRMLPQRQEWQVNTSLWACSFDVQMWQGNWMMTKFWRVVETLWFWRISGSERRPS
jgi:hypothetical protein